MPLWQRTIGSCIPSASRLTKQPINEVSKTVGTTSLPLKVLRLFWWQWSWMEPIVINIAGNREIVQLVWIESWCIEIEKCIGCHRGRTQTCTRGRSHWKSEKQNHHMWLRKTETILAAGETTNPNMFRTHRRAVDFTPTNSSIKHMTPTKFSIKSVKRYFHVVTVRLKECLILIIRSCRASVIVLVNDRD